MKSFTTPDFWKAYAGLPQDVAIAFLTYSHLRSHSQDIWKCDRIPYPYPEAIAREKTGFLRVSAML
jgi:hypothetical protein